VVTACGPLRKIKGETLPSRSNRAILPLWHPAVKVKDVRIDLERSHLRPKTRKGRAPVPLIRQLADRLEIHRLRRGLPRGSPNVGPIFANALGKPLALSSVVNRVILPALESL